MKERIMGKGSIKGRLGKDDQAAETKDPGGKRSLAYTFFFFFFANKYTHSSPITHMHEVATHDETNASKLPHG